MCNADTCTYTVYTQCICNVCTYYVHGRREQSCCCWAWGLCRGLCRGPCQGRELMAANTYETCTDMYIQCTASILVYIHNTNKYIRNSMINLSPYHEQTVHIHYQEWNYMHVCVHTCRDSLYIWYIHGMYKITILWTCISRNKKKPRCWVWTHDFVHTSQLP